MERKGNYTPLMGFPVRLLSKREVWLPLHGFLGPNKSNGPEMERENCFFDSRSFKEGYKAGETSNTRMLNGDDICGGPDLGK